MDWLILSLLVPFLSFFSFLFCINLMATHIFGIVITLLNAYILFVIARKLDCEYPWFAFIPILNVLLLFEMTGKPYSWFFLLFVPLLGFAITAMLWMEVASDLGLSPYLGVLFLFPLLGMMSQTYIAWKGKPVNPGHYSPDRRRRYA
ncbi:MAG: hypothetical protein CVV64_18680 [Candidatus Wallbacteria bacterium HGW-Wallbacteria-1]|jgi:hypothetical protein|uniref:Signal peptidase I n=1 Tax=Candidatus Wallbacteria bacterium HGW-Wallbacteria-1 TaxID=2013854 RepID=A0A2N1PJI7_9BACT|nr:MAG: hypothetical protein CVV64_18680 [Candidatus Wallbacteria bacterium HGW-Wallbacteria-1]